MNDEIESPAEVISYAGFREVGWSLVREPAPCGEKNRGVSCSEQQVTND